jgi:hypothetical protein
LPSAEEIWWERMRRAADARDSNGTPRFLANPRARQLNHELLTLYARMEGRTDEDVEGRDPVVAKVRARWSELAEVYGVRPPPPSVSFSSLLLA